MSFLKLRTLNPRANPLCSSLDENPVDEAKSLEMGEEVVSSGRRRGRRGSRGKVIVGRGEEAGGEEEDDDGGFEGMEGSQIIRW